MVTRRFNEGLAWLHARVGRRIPVELTPESHRSRTNSHAKANAALLPTVYLPAVPGAHSFSLLSHAA